MAEEELTIRFLSNDIRSDSLKIIVHEKKCSTNGTCTTNILNSKIKEELLTTIIRKAAVFEKASKAKK